MWRRSRFFESIVLVACLLSARASEASDAPTFDRKAEHANSQTALGLRTGIQHDFRGVAERIDVDGPVSQFSLDGAPGVAAAKKWVPCDGPRWVEGRVNVRHPKSSAADGQPVAMAKIEIRIAPLEDGGEDAIGDLLLGTTTTSSDGRFRFCDLPDDYTGRELYFVAVSENVQWNVREAAAPHELFRWSCLVCTRIPYPTKSGSFKDQVIDAPDRTVLAFWAFTNTHLAWEWVTWEGIPCWDPRNVHCSPLRIRLRNDLIDWYAPLPDGGFGIEISPAYGASSRVVLFHEIGHALEHRFRGCPARC